MTDPSVNLPAAILNSLLLDTSPYLSCDECFDQLDIYVERLRQDPTYRDVSMQVHLSACAACAEEAEALMDLLSGRAG